MNDTLNLDAGSTLQNFAADSYKIKSKSASIQEQIDSILDDICEVKGLVDEEAKMIEAFVTALDSVTWVNKKVTEEYLANVDAVLSIARSLLKHLESKIESSESFLREYCPNSLENYKEQIDLLEEAIEDIHDIFFVFPKDKNFMKVDNQLDC